MMSEINKIAFIGSGNVASHLAQAFDLAGLAIEGIYGRNQKCAQELASKYQCKFGEISEIDVNEVDLIIISVPDHAIEELLHGIPASHTLIAHTSGSLNMEVLAAKANRSSVFYPLQTFSKEKEVDFNQIPIMIEANEENDLMQLDALAKKISPKVYHINSQQRKKIHIAAVFAANFSNYLYQIADDLLTTNNIPFEVIQALIIETAQKVQQLKPYDAQTGPAVRRDMETVNAHLKDLEEFPEYQKIYQLLSEQIIQSRKE